MTSEYFSTIITALAALLLGASGGVAFVGSRHDTDDLQTRFLNKDPNLTSQQAADKADECLKRRRIYYFILWILALVALILAVVFTATAKPTAPPEHNKTNTMQQCCKRNIGHALISAFELSSIEQPRPTGAQRRHPLTPPILVNTQRLRHTHPRSLAMSATSSTVRT